MVRVSYRENENGPPCCKPDFEEATSISAYTLYFHARRMIGPSSWFTIGLPYSHLSSDFALGESENGFGNLYLGAETRRVDDHYGFDFGLWLPIASEEDGNALFGSILTDLNRWESFFPDILSARLGATYWSLDPEGRGVRLRLAPSVMIPTESGGDAELFAIYSAHFLSLYGEWGEISGGVMGRLLVTEDGDLGDRSAHQVEVEAMFKAQAARFGLVFLLPIDETDFLDFVLGAQLGVAFE